MGTYKCTDPGPVLWNMAVGRAAILYYRQIRIARARIVLYSTVQYSAVQCSAVQYSAVQYSAVQYSTVQYGISFIRTDSTVD